MALVTDAPSCLRSFGPQPGKFATKFSGGAHFVVVAGVNLPMLVRSLHYPKLGLAEMAKNAVEGGQRGIVQCPRQ